MASPLDYYKSIASKAKGSLKSAWNKFIDQWRDVQSYKDNIQQVDRVVGRPELKSLLSNNICEIVFTRRRPERAPGRPYVRRMLCSNAMSVLNSWNGHLSLHFHLPRTGRRIDEVKHNIVVVWDILECDYRNVSMDECYLRQIIPGDDTFWQYYNEVLYPMTPEQKRSFEDTMG